MFSDVFRGIEMEHCPEMHFIIVSIYKTFTNYFN